MHEIIVPSQLKDRISKLGIAPTVLAKRIGIHHTILMRVMKGRNCQLSTLTKISEGLQDEELRLQTYLNGLHPMEKPQEKAA